MEVETPERFHAVLGLLLWTYRKGRWNEGLTEDWGNLVQWGWLVGVSLPERVEECDG